MATESHPLTILVAFATANTGSKVVEYLSKSKDKVAIKGLVRNPDKPEAQALAGLPNVTLVKGEIENDAALKEALKGVSRAFLVTGPGEDSQYDREVTFIKAATEAGVEAIVRISTANCLISPTTTNVYARAHARIEEYIEKHKSPVIDLRPNWYMSNWLSSAGEIKGLKRLSFPIKPDNLDKQKFAMVDTRDVAGAAAAILLLPSDQLAKFLEARAIEVHGPQEVSFADKLKVIEKATGHQIEYSYVEPEKWAEALQGFGMSKQFADSFLSTVLIIGGEKEPKRPYVQKTSALLLDVYTPKYTVQDWAKDNKEAFA